MDNEFLADSNGEFRSLQNRVCAHNAKFQFICTYSCSKY